MFGTLFWEKLAGSTAQEWSKRLFSPALIFWVGSLLSFVTKYGWGSVGDWLRDLDTTIQIVLALTGIIGVAATAMVVEEIQYGSLRLLMGFWPRPLRPLLLWFTERIQCKISAWEAEWQELASRYTMLTVGEAENYARIDQELAAYPVQRRLLPTRLGNCLQAAEDYAWLHYGLAASVVWPRLWLILPENAQKEISEAQNLLYAKVRLVVWSVLFLIWCVWAWWVIPAALVVMLWGYARALAVARVYSDLLRTAFDLYRLELYKFLRWPLPANPEEEHYFGRQLTAYLQRGSDNSEPSFSQVS